MTPERLTATGLQFQKVLLRMMPQWNSVMPEGKLVAAIFTRAWYDAYHFSTARTFFTDKRNSMRRKLCENCGLDEGQVQKMYLDHNPHHKEIHGSDAATREGS